MRHRIKIKKFSRHRKHRKALFKNLIQELVIHERISKVLYIRNRLEYLDMKIISWNVK